MSSSVSLQVSALMALRIIKAPAGVSGFFPTCPHPHHLLVSPALRAYLAIAIQRHLLDYNESILNSDKFWTHPTFSDTNV